MTAITGLTAERMLDIEASSVVSGAIVGDNLVLTKHDGSTITAGPVVGPQGEQGPQGLGPGMIPGEVRMWSGDALPDPDEYSTWVWADGAAYTTAAHPLASANISNSWKTVGDYSDPGAGYFRVPDLRGVVPAGMDGMPGGSRINRMTRSVAITLAAITGEETHVISIPELPAHHHIYRGLLDGFTYPDGNVQAGIEGATFSGGNEFDSDDTGSGTAHENVQPTIFVPYIVCLDG